jgi:hypothetical protein
MNYARSGSSLITSIQKLVNQFYLFIFSLRLWRLWREREMPTEFWWGSLKERGYLNNYVQMGVSITWTLNKCDGLACTGLLLLRMGKNAGFCKKEVDVWFP